MKENKYDQDSFFQKYSQMSRSQQGLEGAGEWHELEKLLPDFTNQRVLDLGCGYGWHCWYAMEHLAKSVIGVDISQKMLDVAKQKHQHPHITYQNSAMEDLDYQENSFDIVMSSLAFHYINDFQGLVKNISYWLSPGGYFVFSVEHPIFTAQGSQQPI